METTKGSLEASDAPPSHNLTSNSSVTERFTAINSNFNVEHNTTIRHPLENYISRYPRFNFSIDEVYDIMNESKQDSHLDDTAWFVLMILYLILIVVGLLANLIVGCVVTHKSKTKAKRNQYVVNLAVSDITLCVICMPFTMVRLMKIDWSLGSVICKLVPVVQCSNILVSTATIVAIAIDRYLTIMGVRLNTTTKYENMLGLTFIWAISLIFPMPLYFFHRVEPVMVNNFLLYNKCVERWPSPVEQITWLTCLILIQYLFPLIVLLLVHTRIKTFLKKHHIRSLSSRNCQGKDRNHNASCILMIIAIMFTLSWLPWHVVNILADFNYFTNHKVFYALFGTVHVLAMSTVISNPILYGWLNTNLRREIKGCVSSILNMVRKGCLVLCFIIYGNTINKKTLIMWT